MLFPSDYTPLWFQIQTCPLGWGVLLPLGLGRCSLCSAWDGGAVASNHSGWQGAGSRPFCFEFTWWLWLREHFRDLKSTSRVCFWNASPRHPAPTHTRFHLYPGVVSNNAHTFLSHSATLDVLQPQDWTNATWVNLQNVVFQHCPFHSTVHLLYSCCWTKEGPAS